MVDIVEGNPVDGDFVVSILAALNMEAGIEFIIGLDTRKRLHEAHRIGIAQNVRHLLGHGHIHVKFATLAKPDQGSGTSCIDRYLVNGAGRDKSSVAFAATGLLSKHCRDESDMQKYDCQTPFHVNKSMVISQILPPWNRNAQPDCWLLLPRRRSQLH